MNGEQFKMIINQKYKVNTLYWAPEIAVYKFHSCPVYNPNDLYQTAAIILTINEQAFKNRVLKVIDDDWINKDQLNTILNDMISILTTLNHFNDPKRPITKYSLSDWQLVLLHQLKTL